LWNWPTDLNRHNLTVSDTIRPNFDVSRIPETWERAKGPTITSDSAEKPIRSSFESLRTNGGPVEIIGDFSVHAESKHS
jgi:hypothetical protein